MLTAATTSTETLVRTRSRNGGTPCTREMTLTTVIREIVVDAATATVRMNQSDGPTGSLTGNSTTMSAAVVAPRAVADTLKAVLTNETRWYTCTSTSPSTRAITSSTGERYTRPTRSGISVSRTTKEWRRTSNGRRVAWNSVKRPRNSRNVGISDGVAGRWTVSGTSMAIVTRASGIAMK